MLGKMMSRRWGSGTILYASLLVDNIYYCLDGHLYHFYRRERSIIIRQEEFMVKMGHGFTLFVALFLLITGCGSPEREKTISNKNQYGGKTKQIIFSQSEDQYKKGLAKEIIYLNDKGKTPRAELYFTDAYSKEKGISKMIEHYDENQNIVKQDSYFTNDYSNKGGVAKETIYRDCSGKIVKAESYFTDAFAKQKGIGKLIDYYDGKDKPVKTESYDQNGNLLKENL